MIVNSSQAHCTVSHSVHVNADDSAILSNQPTNRSRDVVARVAVVITSLSFNVVVNVNNSAEPLTVVDG